MRRFSIKTSFIITIYFSAFIPAHAQGWFIQTSFSPSQSLHAIKFYDENTGWTVSTLYNSSNFNIHKTTNGGTNWTSQNSGYTATRFMSIWIISPDTLYMSGNFGLIIRTTNGGQNWVTMTTGVTDQLWAIQFVNRLTGYVAGSSGRIMKSTDGGESWTNQISGTQTAMSGMHFRNENTGYVSGYKTVLKTTNGGTTWVDLNAPYINQFENFREIVFTDDMTGYYVSDLGRILKTTNAGSSWTLLTTGTTEALFGIFFTSANSAWVCGYNGTIISTTDAGATWTAQVSGLSEILFDIWFTTPNTGYISSWSGKVLKTTNGGITFVKPLSSDMPEEFSLGQNYPNPFNPVTNFKFQVSKLSDVSISLYDLNGRFVKNLVNERMGPGTYEVSWNASGFTSGVYFYRLTAAEFEMVKRMVLLK